MKDEIKRYFESLEPEVLGIKDDVRVKSISVLGSGSSNFNYLVRVNDCRFVFRFNMMPSDVDKSRKEFVALKAVEKYSIAPKALILDDSRKIFDSDFIVLEYLEGKVIDHRKKISNDLISSVARILSKIHSVEIGPEFDSLERWGLTPKNELDEYLREYLDPLRERLSGTKLLKLFEETAESLGNGLDLDYVPLPVLSHGDVCVQNVIFDGEKHYLIDFEDLEITDIASSVAHIFVDFKTPFNDSQKKAFLYGYGSVLDLEEKVEGFMPLKFFGVMLWAVKHYLDFKDGKMHEMYKERNTLKSDLTYAVFCFKQAVKYGCVDSKYKNFNIKSSLESL